MDVQTAAASFVASVRALGLPEDASTLCVFPALHVYFDGPEAGPFFAAASVWGSVFCQTGIRRWTAQECLVTPGRPVPRRARTRF